VVEELPEPEVVTPITEATPVVESDASIEPVVVPVEEIPPTEEPEIEEEEKDFEKLFTLQNVITQVPVADEEEEGRTDKKDAKKKGRKDRVIEFDEESGQAVAHKKHKRDDGVGDVEW